MSDIGIRILQSTETVLTASAPWVSGPNSLNGKGVLSLRLTTGKNPVVDFLPDYIPRAGALPKIDLSVDLEGGGDYEQLRAATVHVADQMADGTSMSAWLKGQGVNLAGALISLHYPIDDDRPIPAAFWTGMVRNTRLTDTRLEMSCESDLDSDAIGEIVSDSAIRPIVYGASKMVKLPSLPVDEVVVDGIFSARVRTEPVSESMSSIDLRAMDLAGLVTAWTDIVTKRYYVTLAYGFEPRDLTEWFPGNIVPATNDWYLEVSAGKGKGQVRRLTAGSTITITGASQNNLPHPLLDQNLTSVRNSETQHVWTFEIDFPFISPDDDSDLVEGLIERKYNVANQIVDTWIGGEEVHEPELIYEHEIPAPYYASTRLDHYYNATKNRSYVSIVRKGKQFSLPINNGFGSTSPIYAKGSGKFIRVDTAEELFRIDSDSVLRIIPSATSATDALCYTRLVPDWDRSRVLARGMAYLFPQWPYLESQLQGLMSGTAGAYQDRFRIPPIAYDDGLGWWRQPYWTPENHIALVFANPEWDFEDAKKLILSLDMTVSDGSDPLTIDRSMLCIAVQANRPSLLESWWQPYFPNFPVPFRSELNRPIIDHAPIAINSMPPGFYDDATNRYNWLKDANKIEIDGDLERSLTSIVVFIGARRNGTTECPESYVDLALRQIGLFASRTVSLTDVYVDLNGPAYTTDGVWTKRIHGGTAFDPPAVALTDGIDENFSIDDHAHAFEDIFRRHTRASWGIDPVDGASIEQACADLWAKTQINNSWIPDDQRPKLAMAITESAPQVGDVCAQLCRDGMLVGSRNGMGQRVANAFLARTLLAEQDSTILEEYLFEGSISEAPTSPLSKLCSSPLIRYAQQAGAPTQYIQVLRPDAAAWQPGYTLGFPDDSTAMRAWNICHRGWTESGVAHAREIRLDTIPEIDSLLAMVMQPRGITFLDWISRPKRRLSPVVGLNHPAAKLSRGSRVRVFHWRYAPLGDRGTIESVSIDLDTRTARITLIMDLDP